MTDYNDLLYKKVQSEYNAFIEKLVQMTPEQVAEHAYEKVIKQEIVCVCDFKSLSQQEAKALCLEKQPLDRIYGNWLDNDYSYMNMIQETIHASANNAIKEMKAKRKEGRCI